MPNGSEVRSQRTINTVAERQKIHKTLLRKLKKIKQHKLYNKPGLTSGAPEG